MYAIWRGFDQIEHTVCSYDSEERLSQTSICYHIFQNEPCFARVGSATI